MKRTAGNPSNKSVRGRWSDIDMHRLEQSYGTCKDSALVRMLRRPIRSIHEKAAEIFSKKKPRAGAAWQPEEDDRLRMCLGVTSVAMIARILARSEKEVRERMDLFASSLRDGRLDGDQRAKLRRLYGTRDDQVLAVVFACSLDEIKRCAEELSLAKDRTFLLKNGKAGSASENQHSDGAAHAEMHKSAEAKSVRSAGRIMPRWTDDIIQLLIENYPHKENVEVAKIVKKSSKSVMSKAHSLGLRKSSAFLATMGRNNVSKRYKKTGHDGGSTGHKPDTDDGESHERESGAEE